MLEDSLGLEILQAVQPLLEPLANDVLEVVVEREARRHVEVRQVIDGARQIDVAALGDPECVGHRLRKVSEDSRHLFCGLQVELITVVAQTIGVVHGLARADAQQDVVRTIVRVLQVVHVVRAHERDIQIAGNRRQADVDDALVVDALVLHLEKEIAGAKDVAIGRRGLHRLGVLLGTDARRDLALEAAAEADEPGRMRRKELLVDARLVVEPFGVAG